MSDLYSNLMIGGIFGTLAFVVVKGFIDAQNTSTWTALERSTAPLIPTVVAVVALISIIMVLTKVRSAAG